jgi:purine-nucleoside phosphorylase
MEWEQTISYHEIPGFVPTTIGGHAGRLLLGNLHGLPTVVLDGRCHRYEGHPTAILMLPIRVLHALGVETLILSNAAGGLNPDYRPGDLMLIRDHLSFQGLDGLWRPQFVADRLCRHSDFVYDNVLSSTALMVAQRAGIALHQGVYVGVTGPNYETRAEYRLFRWLGGDAVGMSTIAEAVAAAECGLRTIAFSVIANVAHPDAPQVVTHEQVVAAVAAAAPRLGRIVRGVLEHAARHES